MSPTNVSDLIKRHEGRRLLVYDDATGLPIGPGSVVVGHPTIGDGIALDVGGITNEECDFLRENRINACEDDLELIFARWASLAPARQAALLDMRYNLGWRGFREFKKMIAAVNNDDWPEVAAQAKNSKWFHQTGIRGTDDVRLLATGEF